MQTLIAKAETLLEALPYIQKYSGATFVIKYGGSFMDSPDPQVPNSVARDIVFLEAVEINPAKRAPNQTSFIWPPRAHVPAIGTSCH